MYEKLNQRLAELSHQFEQGNAKLIKMERERTELRETVVRIQGAIMVLKELSVEAYPEKSPSDFVEETAEVCMPVSLDEQFSEDN